MEDTHESSFGIDCSRIVARPRAGACCWGLREASDRPRRIVGSRERGDRAAVGQCRHVRWRCRAKFSWAKFSGRQHELRGQGKQYARQRYGPVHGCQGAELGTSRISGCEYL